MAPLQRPAKPKIQNKAKCKRSIIQGTNRDGVKAKQAARTRLHINVRQTLVLVAKIIQEGQTCQTKEFARMFSDFYWDASNKKKTPALNKRNFCTPSVTSWRAWRNWMRSRSLPSLPARLWKFDAHYYGRLFFFCCCLFASSVFIFRKMKHHRPQIGTQNGD